MTTVISELSEAEAKDALARIADQACGHLLSLAREGDGVGVGNGHRTDKVGRRRNAAGAVPTRDRLVDEQCRAERVVVVDKNRATGRVMQLTQQPTVVSRKQYRSGADFLQNRTRRRSQIRRQIQRIHEATRGGGIERASTTTGKGEIASDTGWLLRLRE